MAAVFVQGGFEMYDSFYAGNTMGVTALFWKDRFSMDYFADLPKDMQQALDEHTDEIHSVADMHRVVDNLNKKA